ncbi:TetR/AcrR family transcriptional regulator [Phyllobacterium zundukense]|uniref:TetR/AcrR family transcriptional regulator n=1 Tax=Phyllobacterium zundukense TaxID=1867719 RepID=A0ACD4CYH4_9HYPH|nr:TetR/AcrR family transcriptional regulator [Phyllobacterium zundukense]UXN58614.1 TetR/AcrR family transcriptional regulator [Phyllobacterium zundukense]
MREESRAKRHRQIEEAAYRVLKRQGYGGASMLAVAKEAKASNETLYRWYGDKRGLFKMMVEGNAKATTAALEAAIGRGADPLSTLEQIAPVLLSMLLGERAIALNRAAASDESGELGATIASSGRESVFPLMETLIQNGLQLGVLAAPSAPMATEWFLSLLIGDQQIRRAVRAMALPSEKEIRSRAATTMGAFRKLCAV